MAFDNTWQPLENNKGCSEDDDGNNCEDHGDIMIAIEEDEDEDNILLQLLRCIFL